MEPDTDVIAWVLDALAGSDAFESEDCPDGPINESVGGKAQEQAVGDKTAEEKLESQQVAIELIVQQYCGRRKGHKF